ncbi:HpcH/HpaI aldolase family protein [Amedibacillus sp. YH-ame6]
MKNTIREALDNKEFVIATRVNATWPLIEEVVGCAGAYDYVEFLGEYAPFDQYDMENMCRAAELHNIGMIIKADYYNRTYVSQKAMAAGFQGILFTDHTTAEEVEETIRSITPATPQLGGKMGFVNRRWIRNADLSSQMEYAADVNKTVKGFMIEKVEAVENIDAICSVPGVDFIQFGGADFSMNCGVDRKNQEAYVKEVEKKVIETAIKHGVSVRVEIKTAKEADYYLAMGVKHFALGTDLRILKDFYKKEGEELLDACTGGK